MSRRRSGSGSGSEEETSASLVTTRITPREVTAQFPPAELAKFRITAQDTLAKVPGNQTDATARINRVPPNVACSAVQWRSVASDRRLTENITPMPAHGRKPPKSRTPPPPAHPLLQLPAQRRYNAARPCPAHVTKMKPQRELIQRQRRTDPEKTCDERVPADIEGARAVTGDRSRTIRAR